MIALLVLFAFVVLIPMIRLVLSGLLYGLAAVSGRHDLRLRAARMMPRIGHLIGSLVVGVASIAAPAMAQPHTDEPQHISMDRDTALPDQQPTERVAEPVSDAPEQSGIYVVKVGDSLWSIAAAQREHQTDAQTTETWKAIWRANRKAIGDRPELIRPGTELIIEGPTA